MPMIRPEVLTALLRWREALGGLAVAGAGGWVWSFGGYFYHGLGLLFGLTGLGLAVSALWHLRFRGSGAAPGVVQVDEGQITYLSPGGGGFAALGEITLISVEFDPGGRRFWHLAQPGLPDLWIPTDAKGAEALFDAFMSLPGTAAGPFLHALERPARSGPATVWRRGRAPDQLR